MVMNMSKKEIDNIVESLDKYFDTDSTHNGYKWDHAIKMKLYGEDISNKYYGNSTKSSETLEKFKTELAQAILTKLKENEIILAKGNAVHVCLYDGISEGVGIGNKEWKDIASDIIDFIERNIGKKVILKVRMEDEEN